LLKKQHALAKGKTEKAQVSDEGRTRSYAGNQNRTPCAFSSS